MNKPIIAFYANAGILFPIAIGVYTTILPETVMLPLSAGLGTETQIMGMSTFNWESWGMMSAAAGISFIIIGLLNIHILRNAIKKNILSFTPSLVMAIFWIAMIYMGQAYNNSVQFYTGLIGLPLIVVSFFLSQLNYLKIELPKSLK